MKKVFLLLIFVFLFAEFTDAQMMNQARYSPLKINSGFTVDDDIDYMKKRRRKRRKSSSRGRGNDAQNVIKFNPLGLIWGNIIFYERVLSENMSVALGVGYYSRKTEATGTFGTTVFGQVYKYTGFNLTPSFRYYFMGEAPRGFYGQASFNYLNRTEKITIVGEDGELKNKITGIGGGLVFGYQWLWDPITLDLNGGIGYTSYKYKYDPDYIEGFLTGGMSFSGVLPAFGISIGYAF